MVYFTANVVLFCGVFRVAGYDKFALMRNDPALIFLMKCGPPDPKDVAREQYYDVDDE